MVRMGRQVFLEGSDDIRKAQYTVRAEGQVEAWADAGDGQLACDDSLIWGEEQSSLKSLGPRI